MRRLLTTAVVLALFSLTTASPAAAQDEGAAASPAPKRDPASFEAIQVAPEELPEGTKIASGAAFVSVQVATFEQDSTVHGVLPKPRRSATQTFAREDGGKGSVLILEYEGDEVPGVVGDFLPTYLWGGRRRSREHPEEFVTQGPLLILLSFRVGDPTAEWLKARMRTRFGIRILAAHVELQPFVQQLVRAYEGGDAEAGLKLIADREEELASFALAHYFRGEFGVRQRDWALAERGYRRAIELDESLEDPLPGSLGWASKDGLGTSLIAQKKYDDAAAALERCIEAGAAEGIDAKHLATTRYNLACALAQLKRFEEAAESLAGAIAANEKLRESALDDEDLAEAIERPEFKKLLGR